MKTLVVAVGLVLAGCAALKNTRAQDLAWERWEQCKKYPSILLQEIRPDGRISVLYTNGGAERAAWYDCMEKAAREQAARSTPMPLSGPTPPLPVVRAPAAPTGAAAASRPALEVGQRWQRSDGTFEVKERAASGYVLEVGDKQYDVTLDGDVREIRVRGEVVVRWDPPFPLFQWPLRVGKIWYYSGRLLNRATAFEGDVKDTLTVEAYEEVRVPAGTFQAFRIGGRSFRYWYSPAVGLVVKHVPYRSGDDRLERFELVSLALPPSLASPAPARPVPGPITVPVMVPIIVANNLVLVPVTFNGSHGATLLLDTGASHTVITPALGKRLGVVVPAGAVRRQLKLVGGRQIEVPFVRLSSVLVGAAELRELEVGVYEVQPDAPQLDGLLGADFLNFYRVTIDQQDRQLRLERKP